MGSSRRDLPPLFTSRLVALVVFVVARLDRPVISPLRLAEPRIAKKDHLAGCGHAEVAIGPGQYVGENVAHQPVEPVSSRQP